MLNSASTNVERIIAKIDNDFNPDNSDWIPRVSAWSIDAMSMLKVLRTTRKKQKLIVHDNIAYSSCALNADNLIVYDKNGCKINKSKGGKSDCCTSSTGKDLPSVPLTPDTIDIVCNDNANYVPDETVVYPVVAKDYPDRYNVKEYDYANQKARDYVFIDNNKLELSFSSDYIYVEYDAVETYHSSTFGCELPVIPNNGLLIEAIGFFCLYKMLCRGSKHPVFNLAASQYGTNPYFIWNDLKDKAARSVMIDKQGNILDDGGIWNSSFFISTFNPRG